LSTIEPTIEATGEESVPHENENLLNNENN